MAYKYVDSATGNNTDTGATFDLAWATVAYALVQTSSAGDIVWVRRNVNENLAAGVTVQRDGTDKTPYYFIGCPRATVAISSATWTNGNTAVSSVVGPTLAQTAHAGRYITAPDGRVYLITYITSTSAFVLDREYVGGSVSGASGASTISADEDYALFNAIDDSAWTIKKSNWNGDAHNLPYVSGNNGAYRIILSTAKFRTFKNLQFKDYYNSTPDSIGTIHLTTSFETKFYGCHFSQQYNNPCFSMIYHKVFFNRCIFNGSGSGSNQDGLCLDNCTYHLRDCAIYGMGNNGLHHNTTSLGWLENVNIGVEVANGDDDIYCCKNDSVIGYDVKLGGTNGTTDARPFDRFHKIRFENYGKSLGKHYGSYDGGTFESVVAGAGTPVPDLRTGGATKLLKISPNENENNGAYEGELAVFLFCHEYDATTDAKTYKYYVQTDIAGSPALSAAEFFLECEYVSAYDDDSEYLITRTVSTNTIATRSGITDWSQYLSIACTPAVASKVRIWLCVAKYAASGNIYVDPQVTIS